MSYRSRADMHIGLDLILESLNSSPTNRMDVPIKDWFLNRTITEFVKNEIDKANKPDENKRVTQGMLTYGDILTKYNNLRTLIATSKLSKINSLSNDNVSYFQLPSDLFRFESSSSNVYPKACKTYYDYTPLVYQNYAVLGGTNSNNIALPLSSNFEFYIQQYDADGKVLNNFNNTDLLVFDPSNAVFMQNSISGGNTHYLYMLCVLPLQNAKYFDIYKKVTVNNIDRYYKIQSYNTINSTYSVSTIPVIFLTDRYSDTYIIANFPELENIEESIRNVPNILVSNYDVVSSINDPFANRNIITTLADGYLIANSINHYINSITVNYIKAPAILTTNVNCDLPDSVHDKIVEDTAKFISAAVRNESYELLVNEANANK